MLFDIAAADIALGDDLILKPLRTRWGVDSDHGRLVDAMIPAGDGAALLGPLETEGVRCQGVPDAAPCDAALVTPWGWLALDPAAAEALTARARGLSIPVLGALETGRAGSGDIVIIRPGLAAIGWAGGRTDEAGARALQRLFETRGWKAILTRVDPYFGTLRRLFAMLDSRRALVCLAALEPAFVNRLWMYGLELLPISVGEVARAGGRIVSLGGGRLLSAAGSGRVVMDLARRGYRIVPVDIGAAGGLHDLMLPLARLPG